MNALEAARKIFNVIVWDKQIPDCYLNWLLKNYRLGVIPYKEPECRIVNADDRNSRSRLVDCFECGFYLSARSENGGLHNKPISHGDHQNLHKVIHTMHAKGIPYEKIQVEEWFQGLRVDVLGELPSGKLIIAELGTLSRTDKFAFAENPAVEEFWFGDKDAYIYTLKSNAENKTEFTVYIANFYNEHCRNNYEKRFHCTNYRTAFDCREARRVAADFDGIPF